jgi:signal transduction histidine kinase
LFFVEGERLNNIVLYVVVYLEGREESGFAEVLRLQRQRRRAELAEQRARLAREIHDGLGAALSSVLMQAEYLKQVTTDDNVRHELAEMRSAAEEGMEELRRAVSMMRDDFELVPALEDWAAQFSSRNRMAVRFDGMRLPGDLSPEAQLALFRVMQEALTNAARHAGAQSVEIEVRARPGAVRLAVHDDGRGFEPDAVPAGHYGLRNMRERLARLGGALELRSRPGEGTMVAATVPLTGRVDSTGALEV